MMYDTEKEFSPVSFNDDKKTANEKDMSNNYNSSCDMSSVDIYLRQISQHAVMDSEHEIDCARKMVAGDKKSRRKMIESNLRLVVKLARRYPNRGLPLLDLIEEGNLGLMHALDKFDPEKGFRFSTYATWWIKQYIERAIMNQSRVIRLPVHVIKRLNTCLRAGYRLTDDDNNDLDVKKISQYLGMDESAIRELLEFKSDVSSLDVPAFSDSDSCVVDYVSDEKVDVSQNVSKEMMSTNLDKWMLHLTDLESQILIYRFGLKDQDAMTLEEVGRIVGLTRERVRQVQIRALKKLKDKLKVDYL